MHTSGLSKRDLTDLQQLSNFSKAEINSWYKTFIAQNPSGMLSKETFVADNMRHFGLSRECWEYFYTALDKDGNGSVDFKEWLIGMYIHQNGTVEEKLELAFKVYDIDGNGFIEPHELRKLAESISKFADMSAASSAAARSSNPEERVSFLMNLMDADKDGKISFEEFKECIMKDEQIKTSISRSVFNPLC